MSYQPGTILARKDPQDDEYDEVRVIGASPVQTGVRREEFTGQLGDEYTIAPVTFGSVIDKPLGELQETYTVKALPPKQKFERGEVTEIEPGPTPEEQFARVEREKTDTVEVASVPPGGDLTDAENIERSRKLRESASPLTAEEQLAAAADDEDQQPENA